MIRILTAIAILSVSLKINIAVAQTEGTEPALTAPTAAKPEATPAAPKKRVEKIKPWKVNALLDLYYATNLNKPGDVSALAATPTTPAGVPNGLPAQNNAYRAYDIYSRQMSLNLIEVSLSHKTQEVGFQIDLDFGHMADINAKTPPNAVVDESSKHIGQAYITYTPTSLPKWSFDIGKFYTFVGLEVPKAKDNWNYSRSLLFTYGIPLWHSGVSARFTANPQWSVAGYVLNGWNTMYSINSGQTFGVQVKFTPNDNLAILYNGIVGPQKAGISNLVKTLHEANVSYNFNAKLSMGLDFADGGEQQGVSATQDSKWTTYSLALKYQINDASFISPRIESFKDVYGGLIDANIQTAQSMTFTYGYKSTGGVETRFEYRQDSSDKNVFTKGDGSNVSSQATALLAFLYAI